MTQYEIFMLESNKIEGEDRINPGDIEALEYALDTGLKTVGELQKVHYMLGDYLNEPWIGKYRTCDVWVGQDKPPAHTLLAGRMSSFFKDLYLMDSWEAHNEFEMIHPFVDLNGRTGRLIWLTKAVNEWYAFQMPFLQAYYYQTLTHYRKTYM